MGTCKYAETSAQYYSEPRHDERAVLGLVHRRSAERQRRQQTLLGDMTWRLRFFNRYKLPNSGQEAKNKPETGRLLSLTFNLAVSRRVLVVAITCQCHSDSGETHSMTA
jgi:hypothetical protein